MATRNINSFIQHLMNEAPMTASGGGGGKTPPMQDIFSPGFFDGIGLPFSKPSKPSFDDIFGPYRKPGTFSPYDQSDQEDRTRIPGYPRRLGKPPIKEALKRALQRIHEGPMTAGGFDAVPHDKPDGGPITPSARPEPGDVGFDGLLPRPARRKKPIGPSDLSQEDQDRYNDQYNDIAIDAIDQIASEILQYYSPVLPNPMRLIKPGPFDRVPYVHPAHPRHNKN